MPNFQKYEMLCKYTHKIEEKTRETLMLNDTKALEYNEKIAMLRINGQGIRQKLNTREITLKLLETKLLVAKDNLYYIMELQRSDIIINKKILSAMFDFNDIGRLHRKMDDEKEREVFVKPFF